MSSGGWIAGAMIYLGIGTGIAAITLHTIDRNSDDRSVLVSMAVTLVLAWPFVLGYFLLKSMFFNRGRSIEEALRRPAEHELQSLARDHLKPSVPAEWIEPTEIRLASLISELHSRATKVSERDVYQVALELLIRGVKPGDQLREFRSPPETWAQLSGRAGVVLVRSGKVVANLVQLMN